MAKSAPNILFCAQNDLRYILPPMFSPNQVTTSPFSENRERDGRIRFLGTPMGEFDIGDLTSRLSDAQRPDLLVVKTDAFLNIKPRGLDKLDIPKVMICGDTQHGTNPLRNVIAYAQSEPFDAYVVDHTRHHIHWYRQAGLNGVHWIPGLLVRDWRVDIGRERSIPLGFVGQLGNSHVRRKRSIDAALAAGLPLSVLNKPQRFASEVYAMSRITLNHSLNGDLNLRVFEALLTGTCLATDRLSPQSGLEILFEPGRDLVLYDDAALLIDEVSRLIADPARAAQIGRAGHRRMQGMLNPARLRRAFLDLALERLGPTFDAGQSGPRGDGIAEPAALDRRLAIYQVLQHHYCIRETMSVFCDTRTNPDLLSDAADLPQLALAAVGAESKRHAEKMNAVGQVAFIDRTDARQPKVPWTFLITDRAEASAHAFPRIAHAIVVADYPDADPAEQERIRILMRQRGYVFSLADRQAFSAARRRTYRPKSTKRRFLVWTTRTTVPRPTPPAATRARGFL